MNKSAITLGAIALIAGAILTLPQDANAYQGNQAVKGPNYIVERHEAMEKAFDNNDYNAWKKLVQGQGRVTQVINQNNFNRFAQAHKLAEEGKVSEANKIRTELGLGLHNGAGQGKGMGRNKSK